MRPFRRAWPVLLAAPLLIAGCNNSSKPVASSASTSSSSSTVSPSTVSPSTVSPSTLGSTPSTTQSSTGGPTGGQLSSGCVSGASYCETFDGSAKGWKQDNQSHFFEGYSSYLGGSYRMLERNNATLTSVAPEAVSQISHDYSVQVDVDSVLYDQAPATAEFGITCWEHPTQDGSGESAFLFFVSRTAVDIDLWDNSDGTDHTLDHVPLSSGVVQTSGANHLTALCIQGTDRQQGGVQAQLSLSINGQKVVSYGYDESLRNYSWSVGTAQSQVGLLVAGSGADLFFKNFAITSRCSGEFCS